VEQLIIGGGVRIAGKRTKYDPELRHRAAKSGAGAQIGQTRTATGDTACEIGPEGSFTVA
jgi:hypothetical protein